MTPESWNTTHFFWNYLHNFELDNSEVTSSLQASLLEGFMEDKVFIEQQQQLLEKSPNFEPRVIGGDKALMVFRNKWRQQLEAEKNAESEKVAAETQTVNTRALI